MAPGGSKTDYVRFTGSQNLRHRLICATLSSRPVRIDDIRATGTSNPGLRAYEASFLRLLDKITNGSEIIINESGTSLKYKPGVIVGGKRLTHDCGTGRGLGYYLEALCAIGIFGKKPMEITLTGLTNDDEEVSVDTFRTVTLPMLKKRFGCDEGLSLHIAKRGCPPDGGGEVKLTFPIAKELPGGIDWVSEGLVKRVRGVAFTARIPPQMSNRLVDGARGVLNNFLPDVYIFTDHHNGKEGGNSPAYGISLVAETTEGCVLGSDCSSASTRGLREKEEDDGQLLLNRADDEGEDKENDDDDQSQKTPEDYGRECAEALVSEIQRGGVCDSSHQALVLTLLACSPDQICRVRLGQLTPRSIQCLRTIRAFFGVTFNIQPEPESGTVFLSCVGAGMRNVAKRAT
jgi:RNA 3'-terminal phosphate cyclase-like protein